MFTIYSIGDSAFLAQILNALACAADVGVVVGKQIGRIGYGIFAPVGCHRGLELSDFLGGQDGTALQRFMLAVVGIDGFHFLLHGLQPCQLCLQLFHSPVIVCADPAHAR